MELKEFIFYIKNNCSDKTFFSVQINLVEVRNKIGSWKLNYCIDTKIIGYEQLKNVLKSEAIDLLGNKRKSFLVFASEQLKLFNVKDVTQNLSNIQFVFRRSELRLLKN